jgi:hypothetical protein
MDRRRRRGGARRQLRRENFLAGLQLAQLGDQRLRRRAVGDRLDEAPDAPLDPGELRLGTAAPGMKPASKKSAFTAALASPDRSIDSRNSRIDPRYCRIDSRFFAH